MRLHDHAHDLRGDNDLLALTRPDVIRAIHDEYLEAGADIIETNTFNATAIAQADYGLRGAGQGNQSRGGAHRARVLRRVDRANAGQAALRRRRAGPTNRTASISPDVNDPGCAQRDLRCAGDAYGEAVAALAEGGADLILVETVFDTLNAKAALFAVEEVFRRASAAAAGHDLGHHHRCVGRTLSGQTVEAFWNSVRHARPLSVGLNCALGAALMRPYFEEMSRVADMFRLVLPERGPAQSDVRHRLRRNAGETSRLIAGLRAERLRQHRRRLLRHHARAHPRHCGGGVCCRRGSAGGDAPRRSPDILGRGSVPNDAFATTSAAIEQCPRGAPFRPRAALDWRRLAAHVGERTNVTGSRAFADLIQADD